MDFVPQYNDILYSERIMAKSKFETGNYLESYIIFQKQIFQLHIKDIIYIHSIQISELHLCI